MYQGCLRTAFFMALTMQDQSSISFLYKYSIRFNLKTQSYVSAAF